MPCLIICTKTLKEAIHSFPMVLFAPSSAIEIFNIHFNSTTGKGLWNENLDLKDFLRTPLLLNSAKQKGSKSNDMWSIWQGKSSAMGTERSVCGSLANALCPTTREGSQKEGVHYGSHKRGACVMMQWVHHLLKFRIGYQRRSQLLCFQLSSLGKQEKMTQVILPLHLCGRLGQSSRLLPSAWSNLGHSKQLGREPADGNSFSVSLFFK